VIFVGFLEMSLGIRVSPGWRMRIDPQVRKESQNPCQIFQLSLDSICFSILSSILPTVADQRSNVLAEQRLFLQEQSWLSMIWFIFLLGNPLPLRDLWGICFEVSGSTPRSNPIAQES
jgi:hypothetical protein